ncbi:hypothetical protein, partial [Lysinibacillus sp. BPa_S21]|uniref:hypothetical protein n=1 Tax=Lysinibacillus sp. BPa_S21 TaxID=2932478 RepID=UPI002011DCB9
CFTFCGATLTVAGVVSTFCGASHYFAGVVLSFAALIIILPAMFLPFAALLTVLPAVFLSLAAQPPACYRQYKKTVISLMKEITAFLMQYEDVFLFFQLPID